MGDSSAHIPSASKCRARKNLLAGLGQPVTATDIVPDPAQPKKRPVGLHQGALSSVEAESVERPRLNDSGSIHETCGGFETRSERSEGVVKAPGATRSIPGW